MTFTVYLNMRVLIFGRGGGQEIFRWDNGVLREATEGGLGDLPQENRSDSERT